MSIGQIYNKVLIERKEKEEREWRARDERVARIARENTERVQQFFARMITQIIESAQSGKIIEERKIPSFPDKQNHYISTNILMTNPENPYHEVWLQFKSWATSEDLDVDIEYRHDGCGMESWNTLVIRPKVF